jgi:FkbM family methyltransferase
MIVQRALRALYTCVNIHLKDIVTFGPSILLRRVLPPDANGVIRISTRLGTINLRPSDSDMSVLRQIFVQKDYDLNKHAQMTRIRSAYEAMLRAGGNQVIIDAGANIGAASIYFSKIFPEARIVAVEPDPQNAEICRRNCESLENVTVVEAAIGSTPGRVKLKRPDNKDKTSYSIQTERGEGADIHVVTVDELLANAGLGGKLFIIKIDIEGFEKDLFSSETSWLSEATVVIIELHDWMLSGQYNSLPFQKAMLSCDFEVLISGENLIFVR